MTTWVRAAISFSVDGDAASAATTCHDCADSPRPSRTALRRSVDLPASAIRASPLDLARYSAVSLPTKPVAPYSTMSNSRGVAVTGPTLPDGRRPPEMRNAGPARPAFLYISITRGSAAGTAYAPGTDALA